MKRIVSILLLLSVLLCSCMVKKEEKELPKMHISEPLTEIMFAVGFNEDDCDLAREFDRVLGEVIEDGTAARLCETHLGVNMICDEPLPASIGMKGDGSLSRVKEAGKIVVGYHKQQQPMSWVDASDTAVGFDAELAREIGRRMGIDIEFEIVEHSRTDTALKNGEIDVILSAFEYTEERAKDFNLSRTYLKSSLVLISPEDAPIDSLSALTEKTVCVCEGTYAEKYLEGSSAEIVTCSSDSNAYKRLQDGKCDAILVDKTYALFVEQDLEDS